MLFGVVQFAIFHVSAAPAEPEKANEKKDPPAAPAEQTKADEKKEVSAEPAIADEKEAPAEQAKANEKKEATTAPTEPATAGNLYFYVH